ncbi:MASE3 domain-containing protein [Geosporobacter ferrireducens]|uniref:histidine kinase n=1 Tax=Geosporobacter ferrireducens TaxID=1424294 RepID=A0A1D8GJY4_9FIRM|nr:MASE3 domain-containing protein [Geosporobacter ferrireducens]AOT71223.1 hypothetical protein Gferi_17690 [Geosporobacter ferrireducens]
MEMAEKKKSFQRKDHPFNYLEQQIDKKVETIKIISLILLVGCLIGLSMRDYRFFHSVIELTGVVVSFIMATIAFNTYHINENNWLIFLGIAQGFIAGFLLLHIITFMESTYFYAYVHNTSVQFWIISSGMEYISLLVCLNYLKHRIDFAKVFLSYLIASFGVLLILYFWRDLPKSYVAGIGFTPLQYMIEYILLGISVFAFLLFIKNKAHIPVKIFTYMTRYFCAAFACQISFLFSQQIGDFSHLLGHIFKIIAIYFMYKALVESSMRKPYELLHQSNQKLFSEVVIRQRAETELRKEKEELQGILNAVGDGILVTDNAGQLIHSNNLFYEMFDLPQHLDLDNGIHLIEIGKDKFVDPDEFEKTTEQIQKMPNEYTDYLEMRDGRIIERVSSPLILDGIFYGKVWAYRDITEKENAEKGLRESEVHHRKLIELLPDAVFLHKGEEPIAANTAALRLMNCNKAEDIKIKLLFNLHPDYKYRASERLKKLTSMETTVGFVEEKMILRDGSVIDVEIGGTSFLQEGEMYIISVVRDISERKKTEKLQRAMLEKDKLLDEVTEYDRLKTEFFSNISHELKTPLNVILGSVQLLKMKKSTDSGCNCHVPLDKYTRIMMQNCYRLLKLINNLIDITRIDSGFMRLNAKNSNIVRIVEDITLSIADFVETKGISLVFDTEIEEKIMACDGEKLERVMLNLLSNAIKFTPQGGQIEVSVYDKGDWTAISVRDTGIGIPPDKKNIIFERFRQVDSSLRREKEGSGIGLSLVKSLVELHRGRIFVESDIREGSEFIIELPVVLMERDDDHHEAEVAATKEVNVERINIEFSDIYTL